MASRSLLCKLDVAMHQAQVCPASAIQPRKVECRLHGLRSQQGNLLSFSAFPYSTLSKLTFLCAIDRAVLDITMSFGFSVGDFIAAIKLANRIRKEFVDAPSQFKAISDEYVI
jgi:hypothetical protein